MPDPSGKILVIRGGAIGDFILTLPALAALRQQFPQTRLELLGYPHIARLALAAGLADDVRSIEARPLAGFFAHKGNLAAPLQEYFAGFAIILSYLYDPDGVFQENVARCAQAQFIAGPHRPDDQATLHATEVFLKPLERLAIFSADPAPRLTFDPRRSTLDLRPSTFDAVLALHPGSGSEKKNWPEPKWAELLQRLVATTRHKLLLVGGEAEGDRLQRLAQTLPPARVELGRNLPLVELAARLQSCHAFIGHDSGISHLAAAVGLPGLALWGETNESVWRPRGDRFAVVREAKGLSHLSVERVIEELARVINDPAPQSPQSPASAGP
ncbi:MAG TPA: glycosyltransferase family 9 protein [Verrucomicrobiae bacterium]|jgi:heptosyltransferase-2